MASSSTATAPALAPTAAPTGALAAQAAQAVVHAVVTAHLPSDQRRWSLRSLDCMANAYSAVQQAVANGGGVDGWMLCVARS